ncbi:MAG: hypothetical protein ACHQ6U_00855 [Thermodesulfobacteriota bacterium]
MKYKNAVIILASVLITFLLSASENICIADDGGKAKMVSLDQICELYLDCPMSADDLYHDKAVKTTVKVSSARKVPSICNDSSEGTFTIEVVSNSGPILECICNAPVYTSIPDNTPPGSSLTAQGTFKSMTGSYTQSEQKQCKVTLFNCSFK